MYKCPDSLTDMYITPSFNWLSVGGEEKARPVLERMGGFLSVKSLRAIPINQLFISKADPGGFKIGQWEVGIN